MQVRYGDDSFDGFDRTALYRLRFREAAAGLLNGKLVDPPVILLFWPTGCTRKGRLFKDHAACSRLRTHRLPDPRKTVETLYLLGEQDRIVGVSGYVVRPPEARRDKPRVSAFTSADTEKILALKPDLVFTFSDLQADIVADLIRHGLAGPCVQPSHHRRDFGHDPHGRRHGRRRRAKPMRWRAPARKRLDGGARASAATLGRAAESFLRGMGRAVDLHHRLGVGAGRNSRRRSDIFPERARQAAAQGPHRQHRRRGRGAARHHHRFLVRQEIPAGQGPRAPRLRQRPGRRQQPPARDRASSIILQPGPSSADRRAGWTSHGEDHRRER